jgi:hypothetical protein
MTTTSYSDKSYVTLERCIICKEDTGTLFLDKRLRPCFDMHTTLPHSVCDKCRAKYLKNGVMLVCPETGDLVVLKEEAFTRLFDKPISHRIVFCELEVINQLRRLYETNDRASVSHPTDKAKKG